MKDSIGQDIHVGDIVRIVDSSTNHNGREGWIVEVMEQSGYASIDLDRADTCSRPPAVGFFRENLRKV